MEKARILIVGRGNPRNSLVAAFKKHYKPKNKEVTIEQHSTIEGAVALYKEAPPGEWKGIFFLTRSQGIHGTSIKRFHEKAGRVAAPMIQVRKPADQMVAFVKAQIPKLPN